MLVTKREPTPGYCHAYSVGTPKWAFCGKYGLRDCKTKISPMVRRVFLVNKRTIFFFGVGDLDAPYREAFLPNQLSVKFVNVGGWLTYGELALDSCAQFLAVAEHRLIPSGARSITHLLCQAGHQSVWSLACQDQVAGGHAGVGVVCRGGAPLSLPSFITPQFRELFRLGRAVRTTLPTGKGGVIHLFFFFVYGYQGRRRILINFFLLISFCRPSLVRHRWFALVNLCSLLVISISAGRFVDLALAYSLAEGCYLHIEAGGLCWFSQGLHCRLSSCAGCFYCLRGHG